jgi:hypothetical protein
MTGFRCSLPRSVRWRPAWVQVFLTVQVLFGVRDVLRIQRSHAEYRVTAWTWSFMPYQAAISTAIRRPPIGGGIPLTLFWRSSGSSGRCFKRTFGRVRARYALLLEASSSSEQLWDRALDRERLNCCVVCGEVISNRFWSTPKAMLYRRTDRGMIDGRMVQAHKTGVWREFRVVAGRWGNGRDVFPLRVT